jgi:hypothetical protein
MLKRWEDRIELLEMESVLGYQPQHQRRCGWGVEKCYSRGVYEED